MTQNSQHAFFPRVVPTTFEHRARLPFFVDPRRLASKFFAAGIAPSQIACNELGRNSFFTFRDLRLVEIPARVLLSGRMHRFGGKLRMKSGQPASDYQRAAAVDRTASAGHEGC